MKFKENEFDFEKEMGFSPIHPYANLFHGPYDRPPRGSRHHPFRGPHPPLPSGPFGYFGEPLPLTIDAFKELKLYIVFIILEHNPDGITGYKIQENYKFPRGSLIRVLDHLEELHHVETVEEVINGRVQKLYKMTESGQESFNKLKEKWANQFALLSERAHPEKFGNPFIHKHPRSLMLHAIDNLESKEDIIDFLGGMRSRIKLHLSHLKKRTENTEKIKQELDYMITKIENTAEFNMEELKQSIKDFQIKLPHKGLD